jgi:hypothetical protein
MSCKNCNSTPKHTIQKSSFQKCNKPCSSVASSCSCQPPTPPQCCDQSLRVQYLEVCNEANFCNSIVKLANISSCGNSPININGNVFVNGTLSTTTLSTCTISSCGGVITITDDVIFQGDTNISGTLNVTNLTIPGDLVVQGTGSFCNNPLRVNTLTPCTGNTITIQGNIVANTATFQNISGQVIFNNSIIINGPGGLTSCSIIKTNNLQSCSGTLNINSPTTFNNGINICGSVQSCIPGGTIQITSNTTFTQNVTVSGGGGLTSCAGVTTNNLSSCSGGIITVNSGINITSPQGLNVCAGPLTVSIINSCTPGGIVLNGPLTINESVTFTEPVSFCGSGIIVSSITSCAPIDPIVVNSDLSICSGILRVATIAGCGSGITVTASQTTFNGDVRVCIGNLFIGNVTSCSGTINVTATNTVFSNNISVCTGSVRTNTIVPCTNGGTITIGNSGVLNVCGGSIQTGLILGCGSGVTINTSSATFTGSVSICAGALNVTTINPCAGGNTITIGGNLNLCGGNLTVSTITDCGSGITINAPLNLCAAPLSVAIINGCGAGLTINPNTTFTQNVTICGGVLTTGTINGCAGSLTINPNTVFNQNVTICGGILTIATLNDCGGNGITVNGDVTFTGLVTFNVTPSLNFCSSPLQVGTLSACPGNTSIIVNTELNLCTGSLRVATINGCGAGITINAPTTFTNTVSICSAALSVNNINPCAGGPITVGGTGITLNTITATNYNLTNTNVGSTAFYSQSFAPQNAGLSAGPINGPGGNVRNFRTIIGTDPSRSGVFVTTDTGTSNVIIENYYGTLKANMRLNSPGQTIPSGVWTEVRLDQLGGSATTGPNGTNPMVIINGGDPNAFQRVAVISPQIAFLDGYDFYFETAMSWRQSINANSGLGKRVTAVLVGNVPYMTEISAASLEDGTTNIPGSGNTAIVAGPSAILGVTSFGIGDLIRVFVFQDSGANQIIGNNVGSDTVYFKGRFLP